MNGQWDPATVSWQDFKTHYDKNGWGEDEAWRQAGNAVKLMNATWTLRKANEKMTNIRDNFTSGLSERDVQALASRGIDPRSLMQQMNIRAGTTAADSYNYGWWDEGQAKGSASHANPTGQTSTLTYQGPQGGQTLEQVIQQYGIQQPNITRESTMTTEQQNRLRALQQLASRSGQ